MYRTFTDEDSTNFHFVYGFCSGNGRAAAVGEVYRLKVFENRLPLCFTRMIILGIMRHVGLVICMGDMRSVRRVLVDEPEEKKSLLRTRHKWQSGT
jgi:hypothetical protein